MTRRDRIALGLFVAAIVAAVLWLRHDMLQAARTPGSSTTIEKFEVKHGSSLRTVLQSLERQHLISDAKMLEWYLRCCKRSTKLAVTTIKAGRYRIVPGQPPIEILRQLIEGKVLLEKVTVLEGWTFAQMRELLAKQPELLKTLQGRSDAQIMEALGAPGVPAEGRFAPDTYSYSPGLTTDMQLLTMAYNAQKQNLQEAWDSRQPDLPLASPDEALALASIVEKETGLSSERARVAGVYINRLRIKMPLQADPTIIYGLGERYDGNIRKKDLTTDGPYNTYTRAGLPPTPIALPGRKSIVAALNPEKNPYKFFVAIGDGSGGHYFAATGAEHSDNVRRYLQRLRAPPADPAAAAAAAAADATEPASAPADP